MWFKRMRIKNVGRFTDFDVELRRGSIGIFGPNGCGKTTLLSLMYASLTNDFGRFDCVKADCVRNTAEEKEESYIEATIEHEQRTLVIRRSLRGKPLSSLRVDAEEPITDSRTVQEKLHELLGISSTMLDLYCFKGQDKIYDFMTLTPALRAQAFSVLCRTEQCEQLWNLLGEHLNKNSEALTQIVDNSDELAQEISTLKAQLEELRSSAAADEAQLLNGRSKASAEEILRRRQTYETMQTQQQRLHKGRAVLMDELADWQRRSGIRERKHKKLKEQHRSASESADSARAALRAWDSYKKYQGRHKQLKDEFDTLTQEGRLRRRPVAPEGYTPGSVATLTREITTLNNTLERARQMVRLFDTQGVTQCPTCQTPVTNLHDHLEEQRQLTQTIPARVEALTEAMENQRTYEGEARSYDRWLAAHEAKLEANRVARANMESVNAPEGSEAELRQVLTDFTSLTAQLTEAASKLATGRGHQQKAAADLEATDTQIAALERDMADSYEAEERVSRATQRLAEHAAAAQRLAALQGEQKGVSRLLEDKEEALRRLRGRMRRQRRLRQRDQIVARAREVLHRDCLPRRVALHNLSLMEGDINRNLSNFGDPFWVEADESLSFIVHKPGEPPQTAGLLSTGQKVILALAFWPAVASLWEANLGMLALDEPTANLDEDNRRYLADALSTLTKRVRGRRQLVMVTHDHNLKSAFDQVIALEA